MNADIQNRTSYTYVLNFIEKQVSRLTKQFKVSKRKYAKNQDERAYAKIDKCMMRINAYVRNQNKQIFTNQANHEIVLQVLNYEKLRKIRGMTTLETAVKKMRATELNDWNKIESLPDLKHLAIRELSDGEISVKNDLKSKEKAVDSDEDDVVEVPTEEVENLKKQLEEYTRLREKIENKRQSLLQLNSKKQHYNSIKAALVNKLLGSEDISGIQRNMVGSQSEIMDELAKLRVNIGRRV